MTADFAIGIILGAVAGGTLGAFAMALLAASSAADDMMIVTPDEPTAADNVALLRSHLSAAQAHAEKERQRADFYSDMYSAEMAARKVTA